MIWHGGLLRAFSNPVLMLVYRQRRRINIKAVLVQRIVLVELACKGSRKEFDVKKNHKIQCDQMVNNAFICGEKRQHLSHVV